MSPQIKTTVVQAHRESVKMEITREEITTALRKGGIEIPVGADISITDPSVLPLWEDPPLDAPLAIHWVTES